MMVEVHSPTDPELRAEIVRRRLAYEADPALFASNFQKEQDEVRDKVQRAKSLLPSTVVDDRMPYFISKLCCELNVNSLRADIVMTKAARTLAALDGRSQVSAQDVHAAATLVLPHRRRRKPSEQVGLNQEQVDRLMQEMFENSPEQNEQEQPQPQIQF